MAEIKLNKRYKYAGDIFQKLVDVGLDIEAATAFLNEVEDADVVEVVRCKDCKYWDSIKNPKHKGVGICIPPNPSLGGYCTRHGATKQNDYCSFGVCGKSIYGVRKDEES